MVIKGAVQDWPLVAKTRSKKKEESAPGQIKPAQLLPQNWSPAIITMSCSETTKTFAWSFACVLLESIRDTKHIESTWSSLWDFCVTPAGIWLHWHETGNVDQHSRLLVPELLISGNSLTTSHTDVLFADSFGKLIHEKVKWIYISFFLNEFLRTRARGLLKIWAPFRNFIFRLKFTRHRSGLVSTLVMESFALNRFRIYIIFLVNHYFIYNTL